MNKKPKLLRKILIVLLILLILLVVLFGALILYIGRGNFSAGWDNFLAAVKGLTTSTEEIEMQIDEGRKQQANVLQQHGFNVSEEDLKKMESGEISAEDFEALFTGNKVNSDDGKQQADGMMHDNVETAEGTDNTAQDIGDEQVSNDDKTNQTETDVTDVVSDNTPGNVPDGDETGVENTDTTETDGKVDKPASDSEVKAEGQSGTDTKKPETNPNKDSGKKETAKNPSKDNTDKDGSAAQSDTKKDNAESDSVTTENKAPEKEGTKTDSKVDDQSTSSSEDVDARIGEIVATMYVYKSQYTGSIASIVDTMYHQFYALPKDQWTYSTKVSIYNQYAGQIASMEAQCDAQVYALVDELRQLLRANGRDESLADALITSYNTEKENSKAYHISRYAD